ncbi:MAG: Ca2+-transporting ATPase [Psychromonas sp.]|jgi:Ca2+-transporting ATPase
MPLFSKPLLILAVSIAQLIHIGAMYTPVLNNVLQIQAITVEQWGELLLLAFILLFTEEMHKYFVREKTANNKS